MKRLPLFIFLICCTTAFGQFGGYSLQIGTNYPIIGSSEHSANTTSHIPSSSGFTYYTTSATLRESYESKPGITISGSVDYKISERFFLSSGLTVNYLRFSRTVTIKNIYPQMQSSPGGTYTPIGTSYGVIFRGWNPDGSTEPRIQTVNESLTPPNPAITALYIQVPILAGTSFFDKKLVVRGGAAVSYLLTATVYKKEWSMSVRNNTTTFSFEEFKENTQDGFNSLSVGGVMQATYQLSKSIGIDLAGQRNFNPIYNSDGQVGGKSKLNLLTLGARYTIGN